MAPTEAGSAVEADGRCCGGVPEQVQMGAPPPLSTESGQPAGPCEALRAAEEPPAGGCAQPAPDEESAVRFPAEDTIFIFDWDDTVLPSTWVQCQGLRLDGSSVLTGAQREELAEVARVAGETLAAAKQHGTVVLVTNAQRGWIELSCQKFMPSLVPVLENVKLLSARTAYESAEVSSPLEWKLRAFEAEIGRIYRPDGKADSDRAWNVLSLGDSLHEREALLRATKPLPNCRSKSLKFVERPDVGQICKQHALVTSCFQQILHHDGNLDLCIRCE
mmetsp:Transcript_117348/g.314596  ORF Transcript_117348/g.314596 Transcript_117348/m.314596 type:complete len:276 (-) Transcript_117348:270-1097(-)